MRLIGSIQGENKAERFLAFLKQEEIEAKVEVMPSSQDSFEIWIANEEQIESASHWLQEFHKDPEDARFETKPHPIDQVDETFSQEPLPLKAFRMRHQNRPKTPITRLLILISLLIFVWNRYEAYQVKEGAKGEVKPFITPIEKNLSYELSDQESGNQAWSGFYTLLLHRSTSKDQLFVPPFTQIKEGEVWRLFTPVFLSQGFFYLLMNMILLGILGREVEERVKKWQYLSLTLLLGIVTNTLEYLMSGPGHVGYTSILAGLAGFIWSRERVAPWEGYPFKKGLLQCAGALLVGFTLLQSLSFLLIHFDLGSFSVNFNTTGLLSGALLGLGLGRISFLSEGRL